MNTLIVTTDSVKHANELAAFLKNIRYVASVEVDRKTSPLTTEDWIKPGRPATDEEIEQLCKEMEKEKCGITTRELKKSVREWKIKKSV